MNLKSKILFSVLFTASLVYIITISFNSIRSMNLAKENAKTIINATANENAKKIETELNKTMHSARNLARFFTGYANLPQEIRREFFKSAMKDLLTSTPEFLSVWSIWEPKTIDHLDSIYKFTDASTPMGNFSPTFYKEYGNIMLEKNEQDTTLNKLFSQDYYTIPKRSRQESILEPYFYSYTGKKSDQILETSMVIPIIKDSRFLGVLGIDVGLEYLKKLTDNIHPYPQSKAVLISNSGVFATHPDKKFLVKSIHNYWTKETEEYEIIEKIKTGKPFSFDYIDINDEKHYFSFAPIQIGYSSTPWCLGIEVPYSQVEESSMNIFWITVIICIVSLLILLFITLRIVSYVVKPITKITKIMGLLSKGHISECSTLSSKTTDEIGQIRSAANILVTTMKKTTEFARAISRNNMEIDFEKLSPEDELGFALLEMREHLRDAENIYQRQKTEESQASWATTGLANFAEIMRQKSENLNDFCYSLISNLVKYLEVNQGGMFVINENENKEKQLELMAAYAYDRRKYIEKHIEFGVGLVGRCAQEAETIYLTEIPENYIKLTSGLGEESPKELLLVPLKTNDIIIGVVEFASFNPIPKYRIAFVEKVGESIASMISSVRYQTRTSHLLEDSLIKQRVMQEQEEELRQNLEELKATQEEMHNKQKEADENLKMLRNIVDLVPFPVFVKNNKRQYIIANKAEAKLYAMSVNELIGKTDDELLVDKEELQQILESDMLVLEQNETLKLPKQIITMANGEQKYMQTIKVPFVNNITGSQNILGVSIDFTERKALKNELLATQEDFAKTEAELRQQLENAISELAELKQKPEN